jgi:hypothetical protein
MRLPMLVNGRWNATADFPLRIGVENPMVARSNMRTLNDILAELRTLEPELRRRYPIRRLGVFGSYVRGTQREDSDLDALVEPGEEMGLLALVGLKQDLSDAAGLAVDVVTSDPLKHRIVQRILSEAVML